MLAVFSIFVLVSPDHGFRSDDTRKPAVGDDLRLSLPHVSSTSVGTGRYSRLCSLLVILYVRFCLFVSPSWEGLEGGRAMAQEVSRRPLTAEARVRSADPSGRAV